MKIIAKILLTLLVIIAASSVVAWKYQDYLVNPWTRDGQVRAYVIQIAPQVSGPIVEMPLVDNQAVAAGDILFEIDPRRYRADVDSARARLDRTVYELTSLDKQIEAAQAVVDQSKSAIDQARAQVRAAEATLQEAAKELARFEILMKDGDIPIARYDAEKRTYDVDVASKARAEAALLEAEGVLAEAQAELEKSIASRGALGDENAQLRAARAALAQAKLNLEFTLQRAPVAGYVTNLNIQLGSQATADQPALALVAADSFWVDAYFRESQISDMQPGDTAWVTLMSYPDKTLKARVASLAWGIAQNDGSTGSNLLPNVSPTFQWIRLAQRIPVRIELLDVPSDVALRVGTTASVMVMTGKGGDGHEPLPVPQVLQ